MTDVLVLYTKYDGSRHWHRTVHRLGQDEHGVWVGARAGATLQRADEPPVTVNHPHVGLFPRDQWWTAWFNGEPDPWEVYVDVTTPPRWFRADAVTMVDLDLDVCRVRDTGRALLLDEDEFADHRVRYGYPPDIVEGATQAARWLHQALEDRRAPLGQEYRTWLARLSD